MLKPSIMARVFLTILSLCLFVFKTFAQTPIDLIESTLKVPGLGEEVFYYGFAEGDQMIFTFEEVKGKPLKEIEIIELPSTSRFMDYKTSKIDSKMIIVPKTGIYKFRFVNSAVSPRICRFKIQRIPAREETASFNTTVYWKTIYDTTYTTIEEKYLVSSDTTIQNITDQVAKVHSTMNANGNKSSFNFVLPPNTIFWSYYVGVNQEGQEAYQQATKELAKSAGSMLSTVTGYGPLAAVALGGVSYLAQIQKGEDIDYYIVDNDNVNLFFSEQQFRYIKKGKVVNDFSRMTSNLTGHYHFCLRNDNAVEGVTASVKVTAIVVTETWSTKPVKKMNVTSTQRPYLKS